MHVYYSACTKCHNVQQCSYIAMLLQLVIAILHAVHSVIMYVDTMQFVTIYVATVYTGTL